MKDNNQKAFSLIELMVVVAIIGIISAIAFPSYLSYVQKSRRSDGQTAVLDLATRLDQYFSDNNTYVGATLETLGMGSVSSEGYYDLSIGNLTGTTFTATATPKDPGPQASDSECGAFTINELGQKSNIIDGTATTVDECWK